MLYREIIAVCSHIHTKHINTLCGQNVELLNVKLAVQGFKRGVPNMEIWQFEKKKLLCVRPLHRKPLLSLAPSARTNIYTSQIQNGEFVPARSQRKIPDVQQQQHWHCRKGLCVCVCVCGRSAAPRAALDADGKYFLWHRLNYDSMGCVSETAVRQATANLWLHKLTVPQLVKTFPEFYGI